jgi:TonB family protein
MRLTLAALSLSILLDACRLDAPPPPPAPTRDGLAAHATPDRSSGGRFFCRTDKGETRELALRKLAVRVTTKPGTVRTHLTMELAGPARERVEAVMRLAVPRGAAVTDAILWVNGRPMNGVFVQRDRARQIYRSIVERRRDPALVTWDGPGWISVSIFPLESGEPRRFELEWIEPAATEGGALQYRVPMIVDAGRVLGRPSVEVDGRAFATAGHDLVALATAPAGSGATQIFAARAPGDPFHHLLVRSSPASDPAHVVMVAETSAAMTGVDRVRQRAALETVLDALPATSKVTLLAADWDLSVIVDEVDPASARQALEKLDGITSAGALHLQRTLADAARRARQRTATAVLFVGRGLDSFGGDAVREPLRQLRDAGARLSVVTTSDVPPALGDAAALTGGEALPAATLDGERGALLGALTARPPLPALAARGLDWRALETVTGQTVWVGRSLEVPRTPADAAPDIGSAEAADLLPLWDRARLAWSEHSDHGDADRSTTTALTPLRALLVLETEYDYKRFGLAVPDGSPQRAGGGRDLEAILGRDSALGADAAEALFGLTGNRFAEGYGIGGPGFVGTGAAGGGTAQATIGLGNVGTIGAARSQGEGNGSGYGRGFGGWRAQAPEVIPGQASVTGSLDKEIIRRIIRRHINEVRFCYEQELAKRPALGGRITVQFTVAPSGQVITSQLRSSTMGDERVESCTVQAVRRWEFPQPPGGGVAVVSYPFVLTPAAAAAPRAAPRAASIAPSPSPGQADDLELSTWGALVTLAGKGELGSRVEQVAALLGLDRTSDPESLAWMIDRRGSHGREILLVARLLRAAARGHDAIRVLSEWAPVMPAAAAGELRRMGADADAAEVLALAQRGQ